MGGKSAETLRSCSGKWLTNAFCSGKLPATEVTDAARAMSSDVSIAVVDNFARAGACLLYTSDAADDTPCVDL
eukprot:8425272-Pyramimonas_sp.AAC.1